MEGKSKTIKYLIILGIIILVVVGVQKIFKQPEIDVGEISLGDGKHLGYLHGIDTKNFTLAFDDAVWLTGVAGQDAAIEAGHCTEETRSECLPNDYFIKNADAKDELLPVSKNVLVFMQTWKMEETGEVAWREIDFNNLADLINNKELHWRILPYYITIQSGKVAKIEEQYIP